MFWPWPLPKPTPHTRLETNVFLKDVKLVPIHLLENPSQLSTVLENVAFVNFVKVISLDKSPIVNVGAKLDKNNVSTIVKLVVLNVSLVDLLVLLKDSDIENDVFD